MGIDKNKSRSTMAAELRRRVKELLRAKRAEARHPRSEAESQRLLNELEVNHIEMAMHNTELRQARDEAETALDKYSNLYDFAPVGYVTLDRTGTIRGVNLTGANLVGIERSRLIGRRFGQFVTQQARPELAAFLGNIFERQDKDACEVTLTRDGKRPLHLRIEAVACNSGEECNVAVIDITDRREAEEKLLKSERQLAEAQSIAHIGSWEWDSIADKVSGSAEFKRIFGLYVPSYDSFLERVHPDDRETVNKDVRETLARQTPYNVHYRIIRPDGVTRVIHSQGAAIADGAGKTVRMIGTVQDVTELKQAEATLKKMNTELTNRATELECANRDLEAFNYTATHDLRSHLNNVYGFSQILLDLCTTHPDELIHSSIVQIKTASERMEQLIDTILDFSRLSKCDITRKEVDLSSVANDIAMLLELASPERRVTFMIAEGISSCVDARLMRIVLENLIINAWNFTSGKDEAVIEFGISEQKGEPAYFVRDNGVGFDMAHADKLFVAFRRLNKEAAFAGQGIGLATVQRIISRHGGRVWAESEQGKGATFYFTLPHTGQITESMIQTLSMPVESNP